MTPCACGCGELVKGRFKRFHHLRVPATRKKANLMVRKSWYRFYKATAPQRQQRARLAIINEAWSRKAAHLAP